MAKGFRSMSTTRLMAEIRRRHNLLPRLRRRRAKLVSRLETLDEQIAALDGLPVRRGPGRPPKSESVTPRRRRRARNKVGLADALTEVVKSEAPMGIAQIMEGVKKRGYKSTSRQFRNIVTQRLAADKRFKRVGRGQYVKAG